MALRGSFLPYSLSPSSRYTFAIAKNKNMHLLKVTMVILLNDKMYTYTSRYALFFRNSFTKTLTFTGLISIFPEPQSSFEPSRNPKSYKNCFKKKLISWVKQIFRFDLISWVKQITRTFQSWQMPQLNSRTFQIFQDRMYFDTRAVSNEALILKMLISCWFCLWFKNFSSQWDLFLNALHKLS